MTVSKVELGEALERCRQRVEFWELSARTAQHRVKVMERAIAEHRATVNGASKSNYEQYSETVAVADRELWGVL